MKTRFDEISTCSFRENNIAFTDSFLGDEGCTDLVEALQHNPYITALDLRGCNIRSDGASALAQMLTSNTSLRTLGLEWNGIGMIESGIQALSKVFFELF